VFILHSPWESDLVVVTKKYYYIEYELKTSKPDFLRDFKKSSHGVLKHDHLKDGKNRIANFRTNPLIPRPKYFYFVTPKGLVDPEDIPKHCGLLEFDKEEKSFVYVKGAPALKNPTKLDIKQIYNVALKCMSRG